MAEVSEPWLALQQQHLLAISEFTTNIQHVAGKNNPVADCLSRSWMFSVHLGINYLAMATDQLTDPGILAFKMAESNLEDVSFHDSGATLCDIELLGVGEFSRQFILCHTRVLKPWLNW